MRKKSINYILRGFFRYDSGVPFGQVSEGSSIFQARNPGNTTMDCLSGRVLPRPDNGPARSPERHQKVMHTVLVILGTLAAIVLAAVLAEFVFARYPLE